MDKVRASYRARKAQEQESRVEQSIEKKRRRTAIDGANQSEGKAELMLGSQFVSKKTFSGDVSDSYD